MAQTPSSYSRRTQNPISYPVAEGEERSSDSTTTIGIVTGIRQDIDISRILYPFAEIVREEIRSMEERMIERIDYRIYYRINELKRQNIEEEGATEKVIMLRSISREQAKEEIMALLDESDKLYYSDIAEALRLDLELVVEIIQELEAEGKVGEAE
ncbi:MAG: hypothetical protein IBX41_00040 [Methanophagales archaeon]|nr:hypothetical protein [Methanophagales archaeon]